MPVRPRGNSFEATVHYKGERYRQSFPTEVEAEAWELQTKADLKRGKIINEKESNSKATLGPKNLLELFDMTYKRYWANNRSSKSSEVNALKCVRTLGEHLHPSMVDETAIDNMIFSFEEEGIAPATINRRLSALSKMLTFAYERQYIQRKPKIDRKREPEHRVRYITEEEEAELLAYYRFIGNEDMRELVIVGIDTGLRLGELRRLNRQVFDAKARTVTVTKSKTGKVRTLPLTSRSYDIIKRRSDEAETPTDALWLGWTNDKIRHLWNHGKSHLKLMGDPQFVPHVMRHTFCSRLVQRKVDIATVCALAGHSSITMTMRYSHLSPRNLVDAVRVLEEHVMEEAAE